MANFFQKLLKLPTRTEEFGSAIAKAEIAFPFSKDPVELSKIQFNQLTSLASSKLVEAVRDLAESNGFDAEKINSYSFSVIIENETRMKWFLQEFNLKGKNPQMVEVIGFIDERGIKEEGCMALVPCRE